LFKGYLNLPINAGQDEIDAALKAHLDSVKKFKVTDCLFCSHQLDTIGIGTHGIFYSVVLAHEVPDIDQ